MNVADWFADLARGFRQLRVGTITRFDHERVVEAAIAQGWTVKMRAGELWLLNTRRRIPKVRERD